MADDVSSAVRLAAVPLPGKTSSAGLPRDQLAPAQPPLRFPLLPRPGATPLALRKPLK